MAARNFDTTPDWSDDDTDEAASLAYWGCQSPDEPIALVPFECGRYVCEHQECAAS